MQHDKIQWATHYSTGEDHIVRKISYTDYLTNQLSYKFENLFRRSSDAIINYYIIRVKLRKMQKI